MPWSQADPYLIEADRTEPRRAVGDRYGAAVAVLAEEFDAMHVATQAVFDRALATSTAQDWADDRTHPNPAGHAMIADAFRAALGI
ncbi:hypothetical protein [Streptacidiphilus carbonis]|uniref:hypothetical protein n=1 Tax=Streptacidiphilus carbonis TaxID=105422 RepID=UPI00069452AF|nr:hypothetical protein [Streptacidiphilus carbonis]